MSNTKAVWSWPRRRHQAQLGQFVLSMALTLGVALAIGFNPALLFTEWPYAQAFLGELFPPNFTFLLNRPQIWQSVFATIGMAFLGTFLGAAIALGMAFFAARNVAPRPWISTLTYSLFTLERVVPSFIILLIFLILAGIGPFAGTLTLIISTIGTFGKLFAEALEEVEPGIIQAAEATGASRAQWVWYALLPEATPTLLTHLFYAFDVNLRKAIGLGIFGGGGLGFDLYLAMGMMEYRSALALMLVIVALVFASEQLSIWLRWRFTQR